MDSPLPALLERLQAARAGLLDTVQAALPGGDVDADQVAANQLAWATARVSAAEATARWAMQTGDRLALEIAEAACREALAAIEGGSAQSVIAGAPLLQSIAGSYRPLEDLGATDEQRLLRATFRDFARSEVAPRAADIHRQDLDIPESILTGLSELGLFGLSIPERYGGTLGDQADTRAMLIATEELSKASLAAGGSLVTRPEILVKAIVRGGTEEQKARWLPRIASGEKLVAVATTEPDFGSDVAALTCRADRVDGGWVINGAKLWCTFAGRAEYLMLLCRTADTGHRGLSVFVAEKPAFPGHEFTHRQPGGGVLEGRAIPTIGYRGMHTFELAFRDYRLPEIALVGGEAWLNRGFYLQMESFATGRLQTAGRAVGVMQAALDDALSYTRDRIVFGRPVAAYGLPRAMLGSMITRVVASRQLSYHAARQLDEGGGQMESSLAKLFASRMAELVTRDAMQLHGGMGYGEETAVSRYFVDARVLSIFEGAEEILALKVIAKALLQSSRDLTDRPSNAASS